MRALLDENVPKELAASFNEIEALHIEHMGKKGVKNGELLQVARSSFDVLITFDRGLLHQHSHSGQSLRILVLRLPNNKKETVLRYVLEIERSALDLEESEHRKFVSQ